MEETVCWAGGWGGWVGVFVMIFLLQLGDELCCAGLVKGLSEVESICAWIDGRFGRGME